MEVRDIFQVVYIYQTLAEKGVAENKFVGIVQQRYSYPTKTLQDILIKWKGGSFDGLFRHMMELENELKSETYRLTATESMARQEQFKDLPFIESDDDELHDPAKIDWMAQKRKIQTYK